MYVTSAYLLYYSDKPHPSKGLREVTDYCSRNTMQLVYGCNATAHHIIQGSIHINPQEECLMEQLVIANHIIINKGNIPTFISSNRKEVTDLTLGTDKILVPSA